MMYLVTLISFMALLREIYKFTHPGVLIKFKEEGRKMEERKKDENYKHTSKDTEHMIHGCLIILGGLVTLPMLVATLFFENTRAPAVFMLGLTIIGVFVCHLFKNDAFKKVWTFIDSGLSIPVWIWLIQGAVYPEFNLVQWIGF